MFVTFLFVYFRLPITQLSDAPRRRLFVTGESGRIQDETTENFAWFSNVLGVMHRHKRPRFKVSSERQLVTSPEIELTTSIFKSSALSNRAMRAGICDV